MQVGLQRAANRCWDRYRSHRHLRAGGRLRRSTRGHLQRQSLQVGLILTRHSRQVRVSRRCCPHKVGLMNSEGGTKSIPGQPGTSIEMQPMTSAEIQPGPPSLTNSKSVSFAPLRGVTLPTGEMYREFVPSDDERHILPASPGPEREQNLLQLQIAALRNPPKKSQSQGKKLWKLVYSKLRKLRPWRRFSRTAVATEG